MDYTDPVAMAEPYRIDELERMTRELFESPIRELGEDGNPLVDRGDAAILATQNDLITSTTILGFLSGKYLTNVQTALGK